MSEKYVNKSGKFNHGKWMRENMSVLKNQDINKQGNSLAYRFTEPQQAAVEKFLKKNSTEPKVKELLATKNDKYSSDVLVKIGRNVYALYASYGAYRLGAGGKLSRWTPAMEKEVVKFLGEGKIKLAERLSRSAFKMMDGNVHIQNMKSALNFLADIYHDLEDEGFEPDEIIEFFVMKIEQKLGGRTR